jgi:hypothetical protein
MKCAKGHEMIYTIWNTEKGEDEGWYCSRCDSFNPNLSKRRNK